MTLYRLYGPGLRFPEKISREAALALLRAIRRACNAPGAPRLVCDCVEHGRGQRRWVFGSRSRTHRPYVLIAEYSREYRL